MKRVWIYSLSFLGGVSEGIGILLTAIAVYALANGGGVLALVFVSAGIAIGGVAFDRLFPLDIPQAIAAILVGFYLGLVPLIGTLFGNLDVRKGTLCSPLSIFFLWGLLALIRTEEPGGQR